MNNLLLTPGESIRIEENTSLYDLLSNTKFYFKLTQSSVVITSYKTDNTRSLPP